MPRKALRVDACAADPTLDVRALGVPPALAAALLGRAGEALDVIEALLATHPVLVVRERPTSPRHVVALRPVIHGAVALHPSRLAHVLGDARDASLLVLMPLRGEARAALLARVDDDHTLSDRRADAAAALGAEASLCLDDLAAPAEKRALVAEAEVSSAAVWEQYLEGVITEPERHNKLVDTWAYVASRVGDALLPPAWMRGPSPPPRGRLRALVEAGGVARGTACLLAGMRGLATRADGSVFDAPVRRSLAEGLTAHEFFATTFGSRRGFAELQAREARSDALLRRLARRLAGVGVTEGDCGATTGLRLRRVSGPDDLAAFARRLRGRVPVADVIDPGRPEVIAPGGVAITADVARTLAERRGEVEVRSPAACRARGGVCRVCMGPLDARERHAGLAAALRFGDAARLLTLRSFQVGC